MTTATMKKFLEDENNKELVTKISELLNGQSYEIALQILQVVAAYLKKNSFVDAFYINQDAKN